MNLNNFIKWSENLNLNNIFISLKKLFLVIWMGQDLSIFLVINDFVNQFFLF